MLRYRGNNKDSLKKGRYFWLFGGGHLGEKGKRVYLAGEKKKRGGI